MAVMTFDPKRVIVTVNGVPITGFADGDSAVVEYDEDAWTKTTGNDGDVCRTYQNRKGAKITLRLMYGSPANAILDTFAKLDAATKINPVAILIKDTLGLSQAFARSAWLLKDPGMTVGREPGDKEWVYDCAEVDIVHGPSLRV